MALDPELAKLMNQTCFLARFAGVSLSGDGSYSAPEPFSAKIEPSNKLLDTTPSGEEVISTNVIYTQNVVGQKDHIYLPNIDITQARNARMAKQVDALYDEDGTFSHYEVYV